LSIIGTRTQKAFSGSLWLITGMGGREVLLFILSILLARILVPADFGAVALVMAIIAVVEVLAQLGLSVALVQKPEVTQDILDSAFVLTFFSFLVASIILVFLAQPISHSYALPLLAPLTQLTALSLFLMGLSSFYRSLLLRDMKYRVISGTQVVSTVVYGIVSLICAIEGYGAYSIILGYVATAVTTLIIFGFLKPFFPKSMGSLRFMKELLGFGAWVSFGRILGTASGQFDRFLIGKILSEQVLGGYYIAYRMTISLPNLVTGAIDQVLLPIYSASKNDPEVIEKGYWKGLQFSALAVVPACLLFGLYAAPATMLLLGQKWMFIVPIIQILSLLGAIQGLGGGVLASAIYASGVPQLNPMMNGVRILGLPISVWVGSRWGIEGLAWGVVLHGLTARLFNQWLLNHYLGYDFVTFFRVISLPLAANLGLVAVSLALQFFISPGFSAQMITLSALSLVAALAAYVTFLRFIMPQEYRFMVDLVLRRNK
jgi:teichuronic acid exporter